MQSRRNGKILFLAANASYSHTNLTAGYLGAIAAEAGWQWRTLEALHGAGLAGVLNTLDRYRPSILAATFYLFNRQKLLEIVSRYKVLYPDCVVIGGGPEFDGDNRQFCRGHPEVDLVVRGEGELPFREWLKVYDRRRRWRSIPGICFCDGRGRYQDGGWSALADNPDDLPSPYTCLPEMTGKPFVLLETSRGCANNCTFCRDGKSRPRFFGMERVRGLLIDLRAAGIREIRVLDRTFNEPAVRSRNLLSMFIEEFSDLRFHCEIDPGRLTAAFMNTLASAPAGQFHLEAGVQTLNREAWRRIRRGTSPRRSVEGLRKLVSMPNVRVHADLIAGLPGADMASLRDDINTLAQIAPSELQLETLKVLPGTLLRDTASSESIVFSPQPPYEVLRSDRMTPAELELAEVWSRVIDWFYNPPPLQAVTRLAIRRQPGFWENAVSLVLRHAGGAGGKPGLRNRFLWLAELVADDRQLVDMLRFEWMLCGLGERAGFIAPRPWRGALPEDASLIAGDTGNAGNTGRRVWVRLDHDYVFEYRVTDKGRRATFVYRLRTAPQDSQSVATSTARP